MEIPSNFGVSCPFSVKKCDGYVSQRIRDLREKLHKTDPFLFDLIQFLDTGPFCIVIRSKASTVLNCLVHRLFIDFQDSVARICEKPCEALREAARSHITANDRPKIDSCVGVTSGLAV
jgi:hypothetical protein